MVAATDYELPGLIRTADFDSMTDARLFSLINELAEREKRRDALLDRMALDEAMRSKPPQRKRAMTLGQYMRGSLQSSRQPRVECSVSLN